MTNPSPDLGQLLVMFFRPTELWQTAYQAAIGLRVRYRFAWFPVRLYRLPPKGENNRRAVGKAWLRFVIEKKHMFDGWLAWDTDNRHGESVMRERRD